MVIFMRFFLFLKHSRVYTLDLLQAQHVRRVLLNLFGDATPSSVPIQVLLFHSGVQPTVEAATVYICMALATRANSLSVPLHEQV